MSQRIEQLEREIKHLLEPVSGVVSVFYKDLNTGNEFRLNENEVFNTASLMKVIIGLQLVRFFESGEIDENRTLKLKNSFASKHDNSLYQLSEIIDSEKSLYSKIGSEVRVIELLELMITQSSNLATNNLFELIKRKSNIADLLEELGMTDTRIVRGVEDQKAYDARIINTTTAADMKNILEHIYAGVLQKNTYLTQLYNFLLKQEHNSIIPARLPENLLIAHKTGNLNKSLHDAAIITSSNGIRYLLVILSKNLENKESAIAVFSKISELIYDFLKVK
jgi:beta-lactamase class A